MIWLALALNRVHAYPAAHALTCANADVDETVATAFVCRRRSDPTGGSTGSTGVKSSTGWFVTTVLLAAVTLVLAGALETGALVLVGALVEGVEGEGALVS